MQKMSSYGLDGQGMGQRKKSGPRSRGKYGKARIVHYGGNGKQTFQLLRVSATLVWFLEILKEKNKSTIGQFQS